MARPYGEKFLRELYASEPTGLGPRLGLLCIKNNLSAAHVAAALEVTRTTVYQWFRGQGVREAKRSDVEALIRLIERDVEAGRLPVRGHAESKAYIEDMIGVGI